jgi:hypothetical protein
MALLSTISELTLVGVADRGVPNKERIVLRPMETVNVGEFALIVGVISTENGFFPLPDLFFWPGNIEISPPSWLYVYTAPELTASAKSIRPISRSTYAIGEEKRFCSRTSRFNQP